MDQATINRLKKYLTDVQLAAFLEQSRVWSIYFHDRTSENLMACEKADEEFLITTNGKKPCELIPIAFWK